MESPVSGSVPVPTHYGSPRERLIVALDFPSAGTALDAVARLEGCALWFKVGLQLYLAAGPSIVETLRSRGFNVFVDLKLHDIPNTVAKAVDALCSVGANFLTVHASGGRPMMLAAVEAAGRYSQPPELLGVTILTSFDAEQLQSVGVSDSISSQVLRLARIAHSAGLAGMVCSPQEVSSLRIYLGPYRLLVVPGIRPAGSAPNDQKRIATPAEAIADGASHLVVGRPITRALDPAQAAASILKQMEPVPEHLSR